MPESGLPIRVWEQDDQWHVDYGDGVVEHFQSEEEATSAAGATASFGSGKVDLTSGTIGPGEYFLVQLSSGGANGLALPALKLSRVGNSALRVRSFAAAKVESMVPVERAVDGCAPAGSLNVAADCRCGHGVHRVGAPFRRKR